MKKDEYIEDTIVIWVLLNMSYTAVCFSYISTDFFPKIFFLGSGILCLVGSLIGMILKNKGVKK